MSVTDFSDIQDEFLQRVQRLVWCTRCYRRHEGTTSIANSSSSVGRFEWVDRYRTVHSEGEAPPGQSVCFGKLLGPAA